MNVDEALRQFADAEQLPREALQWSLDHWDEAAPRFISKLRAYAAGAAGSDANRDVFFYIIHLCGEKRDARGYTPLCELIAADKTFDNWFGDAVTETLPGILINVCDGDLEPLKRAIEAPAADEFARSAALSALAYLVRAKNFLTDDEMRDYLLRLNKEMRPRGPSFVWFTWAFTVAQLGYETLRAEAARLFSKRWIDESIAGLEHFHADLQLARGDADGLAAFHQARIQPFGSTIEAFSQWEFGPGEGSDVGFERSPFDSGGYEIEQPFVNPLRDVGRNDPCPCGSGKKFKKCCLAA
jgi:uncharacterized protein